MTYEEAVAEQERLLDWLDTLSYGSEVEVYDPYNITPVRRCTVRHRTPCRWIHVSTVGVFKPEGYSHNNHRFGKLYLRPLRKEQSDGTI